MTRKRTEEAGSGSSVRFLAFVVEDDNRTRRLLALLYPTAAIVIVVLTSAVALALHSAQSGLLIAGVSTLSLLAISPLRRLIRRIRNKDHGSQPAMTEQDTIDAQRV